MRTSLFVCFARVAAQVLVPSQFTVHRTDSSSWYVTPTRSDIDPGECSEVLEKGSNIRRASMFAFVPTGTSVVPAEESGCFAVSVAALDDGGSEAHSWRALSLGAILARKGGPHHAGLPSLPEKYSRQ